jgi:Protein of unknown function (DUF2934)
VPDPKVQHLIGQKMRLVPEIEIVRRAYQLWQEAGQPSGKDHEFYYQARQELTEKAAKEAEDAAK